MIMPNRAQPSLNDLGAEQADQLDLVDGVARAGLEGEELGQPWLQLEEGCGTAGRLPFASCHPPLPAASCPVMELHLRDVLRSACANTRLLH